MKPKDVNRNDVRGTSEKTLQKLISVSKIYQSYGYHMHTKWYHMHTMWISCGEFFTCYCVLMMKPKDVNRNDVRGTSKKKLQKLISVIIVGFFIPVSSLKVFGRSIHSERRRIYLGKSIQALQNDIIIIS